MRIKHMVVGAAVAVLALGVAGCGTKGADTGGGTASAGPVLTGVAGKAQKDKKLVIGVKADQPGLGLQTGSAYEGFDIEIAKIIAAGLGVPASGIEWKTTVSANREVFLQQGTVDLVIATYTINDDRKKKVGFAGPYFVAGQDLLVKSDNTTITGPDTLDGKKVCSVTGSTPAKRIQNDHPKAQLQLFDTYSKCVEALSAGSVDAVTTDDIILAGYASQSQYAGKLKVVGKPFSTEPYGIGVKKGDTASCNMINDLLKKAAGDGSYKKAWDNSLGKSGKSAPDLDITKLANCS
jgi:glutamate transport system substrate-binding protein